MTSFIKYFLPSNKKGIYLIGGSVRDHLIGITPSDFDLISSRNTCKVAIEIAKKIDGKIIAISKNSSNGIFKIFSQQSTIDIVPLSGKNIVEDILKRDFTINSIAYDFSKNKLLDPVNGLKDIKKRQIRMVTNSVFLDDPIRLIRAYRIALNLNFSINQDTQFQITKNRNEIKKVAGEKIWNELNKIFLHSKSHTAISKMITSKLIFSIFPELLKCNTKTKNQNSYTSDYALKIYKCVELILTKTKINCKSIISKACKKTIPISQYPLLKYASLLCNIQKNTKNYHSLPNNLLAFKKTEREKTKILSEISKRLKLSSKQQIFVNAIINNHMIPFSLFETYKKGKLTKQRLFQVFEKYGYIIIAITAYTTAYTMSKNHTPSKSDLEYINFMHRLVEQYVGPYRNALKKEPFITGHDLIETLGIAPSPKFKYILTKIRQASIIGEISNKESALNMAKKYEKLCH